MARTREVRFAVHIRVRDERTDAVDFAGFVDMLRYDAATVTSWDREAGGYVVKLTAPVFTPARWASFGIVARELDALGHEVPA